MKLARAKAPTPVLKTPHFSSIFGGGNGRTLPVDNQGLLREIELVALKGTIIKMIEKCEGFVWRVEISNYPADALYADQRFLEELEALALEKKPVLPSLETVMERMVKLVGLPYIWGGNWSAGIPALLALYPPSDEISDDLRTLWALKGVDCSGLLYEATDGFTPRNTSELIHYGSPVLIENKSVTEIQKLVRPLDLIVWKGHVVIVVDSEKTIESRHLHGVVIAPLKDRLKEVLQTRTPKNSWSDGNHFVIRRWATP